MILVLTVARVVIALLCQRFLCVIVRVNTQIARARVSRIYRQSSKYYHNK
jgi:hypothetical protein